MKKIAKLSLVAAVAVAGLTSANAGSLENAIKNTDVSGQFRYRMHTEEVGSAATTSSTDVEIEVGVKSKVTDNVTAVFKIDNAPDNTDTTVSSDNVDVEDYYFSYAGNGMTVNLGQQNIPTRQVDGKQGDGIVALTKVAGFTVGAAYFINNNITGGNDVVSALATGKVGPATVLAQYSDVNGVTTALNLMASAKVAGFTVGLESATLDKDASTADFGTTKVSVGGKVANVALGLTHVTTEKGGSGSIDAGAEAPSELTGFQVHSSGRTDLAYTVVKATVPVMAKTSFTLYHGTGDELRTGKTQDLSETFGQLTYKAAKNLTAYVRYGTRDQGGVDTKKGRLEVKYSF